MELFGAETEVGCCTEELLAAAAAFLFNSMVALIFLILPGKATNNEKFLFEIPTPFFAINNFLFCLIGNT